ncbi:hypothetical protein CCHL11_04111 [Colletotrichum chlorophyti]|uniref:CENP-V/GFA domain-containing protein n=1 Tax=Colletotrichum chlorophyti TaxID=708187 RepID=A0A1Q8RPB9_9PEZI|nr:hypothetical protein CCHL11_04111 [Colletotrichum chlorophyti]
MRLASSPDDFLLLKPLNPYEDLGDYTVHQKDLHFLFCKNCGMRCFILMGQGEQAEVDLAALGVDDAEPRAGSDSTSTESRGLTKIWKPRKEGWVEGRSFGSYLSVNGFSVDAGQEGFELREMTEMKWVGYVDWRELNQKGSQGIRYDRPWEGGAY